MWQTWNTVAIAVVAALSIWACSSSESGDASHLPRTTENGQRWDLANLHETPEYKAWRSSTTIRMPESWEPVSVTLLLPDGKQAKVSGRRGTYVFETRGGVPEDWPVVAFVDSSSGHVWIGREMDIYIQGREQILGVLQLGAFEWYESSIRDFAAGGGIGALIDEYNDQKQYLDLNPGPPIGSTALDDVLNRWFFCAHPESSQGGFAKILESQFQDGQLEMRLESPGGDYHAQVWIDLSTREIVKAIEDGKELLPRDGQ